MDDTGAETARRGRARAPQSFDPDRLARYMVLAGVDAEQLAKDAGVSLATVVRARAGHGLRDATMHKIGAALAKYPTSGVVAELLRDPAGVA